MIKQSKARIFLADERGLNETDWFRSQSTFNFGKYNNENKKSFGNIYVLNDDMLAGGRSVSMMVEEDTYVILLPVAGAVKFKKPGAHETLVVAGQLFIHSAKANETIEIVNPFQNETVNYLQIWIKADEATMHLDSGSQAYDDVNENLNQFINAFPGNDLKDISPFSISIGKFSGRGEAVHILSQKNAGCFLFVLNGAFEAEGRLLHERDGLALWDTNEIEMETLSNDAIMLLIGIT